MKVQFFSSIIVLQKKYFTEKLAPNPKNKNSNLFNTNASYSALKQPIF